MKIVHVICSLCTGGAELLLLDIVKCQVAEGHQVSLIVINNKYEARLCEKIPEKVKTYFINRPEGSRNPLWIIKYNLAIYGLNPDVIHFHHDVAIGMTFNLRNTRSAITIHSVGADARHCKAVDKVFSISAAVQNDLLSRYGLNSVLVYNGVSDDSIFVKEDSKRPLWGLSVIQIGRLVQDEKGQDLLIEAVANLRAEGYPIKVDFIGEGRSEDILKKQCVRLGCETYINFLGNRSREYIYKNLRNYDLLVQPSRSEGFGLTVAEAMAAKIPVLVSNLDGPMEVIGNGKYGQFFDCNSVESLVEALKFIYKNYELVAETARTDAYDYCIKNFSVKSTVKNYLENYLS